MAHAAAPRVRVPAVGRSQPQIGCVRGASGLSRCCCCRQLVGPMAGPHVQRQGRWRSNVRQLWAGSESKCAAAAPSSELCALCHGPTPLPRLTRPASCAACWLSVSIDTANLLWLAVVSLAAASLLLLLLLLTVCCCWCLSWWRPDGVSRETNGCCSRAAALLPDWVLRTRPLGCVEAWRRVVAREHAAAAHPSSRTVVADVIVTAMCYIL